MRDWITAILAATGAAFLLVAAIGLVRYPDALTRMQATAKAGTLGVGCLMAAVAVHVGHTAVTVQILLIVLLFLLTAPVGAHRIARAAHRIGVPLWEGTHRDDLRESGVPPRSEDADDSA